MKRVVTVDIGSTWTKGALLDLDGTPRCLTYQATPTTVEDLTQGVGSCLERLFPASAQAGLSALPADVPLYLSSSAKGGLAIAAVGIVPELTLQAARLAAATAGGKIVTHSAYRLTPESVAQLQRWQPDIVLLAGGTDGGNEQYNLYNARTLASLDLPAVVLYAGNKAIRSQIAAILAGKELAIVDNLMPEVGSLVVEPARSRIQAIFLEKIVQGKGLSVLAARCASPPKPTPRAVFELVEAVAATIPEWDDTIVFDMGGATTDVFSCCRPFLAQPGFVFRGLPEPRLKRSVEGDLGMRVNACWAAAAGRRYVDRELARRRVSPARFRRFLETLHAHHEHLPQSEEEEACDEVIAGACLYHGLLRHAGTLEESYTPAGRVLVQRGKDLRGVRHWIGSGGYLSRRRSGDLEHRVLAAIRNDTAGMRLVPDSPPCYADADYLWPLLGNLAADYPAEAARLAVEHLVTIEPTPSAHVSAATANGR